MSAKHDMLILMTALTALISGAACAGNIPAPWKIRAGWLIETENKEGQADKDGMWEPTLWMDFTRDRWSFYGSFYQETHKTDYSEALSRGNWFNQYEFDARYLVLDEKAYALGLTFHFRNYTYIYHDNPALTQSGGYNTQRYAPQIDWRVNFTDKFKTTGWLALYNYANNTNENGIANKELKGEGGLEYRVTPIFAARLNYFIDRGWNTGGEKYGEFCRSQLRPYFPVTLSLFDAGTTTVTPYGRFTLNTWFENTSRNQRENATESRWGIFIEQKLSPQLILTLDYAYELQTRHNIAPGTQGKTKYHKTGIGMTYNF